MHVCGLSVCVHLCFLFVHEGVQDIQKFKLFHHFDFCFLNSFNLLVQSWFFYFTFIVRCFFFLVQSEHCAFWFVLQYCLIIAWDLLDGSDSFHTCMNIQNTSWTPKVSNSLVHSSCLKSVLCFSSRKVRIALSQEQAFLSNSHEQAVLSVTEDIEDCEGWKLSFVYLLLWAATCEMLHSLHYIKCAAL